MPADLLDCDRMRYNPRKVVRRAGAWLLWLVLAALAGTQLPHYRVDNALAEWMPQLDDASFVPRTIILGVERDSTDLETLIPYLHAQPIPADDPDYHGLVVTDTRGRSDQAFLDHVLADLHAFEPGLDRRVALGGPVVFHLALNEYSQRGLPAVMTAIMLVGASMMTWITGSFRVALQATAAIMLSQFVLLGVLCARRLPFDMAVSMAPPMMMALGYSYAAHRALRPHVTPTLIACFVTTALGIASFTLTGLPPIERFARYGVLGLLLVVLAVMMLVPAPDEPPRRLRRSWIRPVRRACIGVSTRFPRWILAFAAVTAALSLLTFPRVRQDGNPLHYFPAGSRVAQDFSELNHRLTGVLPFSVEVLADVNPAPMLEATPGVRAVVPMPTDTHDSATAVWQIFADLDALPALARAHRTVWKDWAREHETPLLWRGVAAQLDAMNRMVGRVALWSAPLMLLIAGLSVGLLTTSLRLAVYSTLVNAAPIAGMILTAVLLDWPLSVPSLMIGAIAVGMAIDDTLHLSAALTHTRSLRRTLVRCWRPCAGSTFTVCACMLLFTISPFGPTVQFGVLMAAAALAALVGDLILWPALCSLWPIPLTKA